MPETPRLAPWTTAVYAVMWAVLVLEGWGSLLDGDPRGWLQQPAPSAERMLVRDIERAGAIEHSRGLERALLTWLYGNREDTLLYAVDVHWDLLDMDDSPGTRERLAILLLESDQAEAAAEVLAGPELREDEAPAPVEPGALVRACDDLSIELREMGLRQEALQQGDESGAATLDASIAARGERSMRRSLALLLANLALLTVGAGLVLVNFPVLRKILTGRAPGPPWPLADGVGVFVRADFWNRLYFLSLAWLPTLPAVGGLADSAPGSLLFTWGTLFASLPLFWLVRHHLLRPSELRARDVFGLTGSPGQLVSRVAVGVAAIAVDLAGTHVIGWLSWWADVGSSWAEGFDEALVWGGPLEAALTSVDYLVWAPACEELAFRGILYFSLRARLGPAASAGITAALFAGLHFYSLPGFLMTLWSGLVWALAFEHSRSLLPGIGAHAVYNALYVAGLVLLYR